MMFDGDFQTLHSLVLLSLVIHTDRGLHTGFCQFVLPAFECYIIWPPVNCPLTPPNTYLDLKKMLYSFKRSPQHWYEKSTQIFKKLGFQCLKNSPCIFTKGEGKDKIFLRLYVDNFVYFS